MRIIIGAGSVRAWITEEDQAMIAAKLLLGIAILNLLFLATEVGINIIGVALN